MIQNSPDNKGNKTIKWNFIEFEKKEYTFVICRDYFGVALTSVFVKTKLKQWLGAEHILYKFYLLICCSFADVKILLLIICFDKNDCTSC